MPDKMKIKLKRGKVKIKMKGEGGKLPWSGPELSRLLAGAAAAALPPAEPAPEPILLTAAPVPLLEAKPTAAADEGERSS